MMSFSGPKLKDNACFAEHPVGLRPVISGILFCMSVFLLPSSRDLGKLLYSAKENLVMSGKYGKERSFLI